MIASNQGEVWHRLDTIENERALPREKDRALAAHRLCRRATGRSGALRPLHNIRDTDIEQISDGATRLTTFNSGNHTLSEIKGVGSNHEDWPPIQP